MTNPGGVKWEQVALGDVCEVRRGNTITRKSTKSGCVPVVAGGLSSPYTHNVANRPANTVTVSGSGANAGFVNFWDVPIYASDCSTVVAKEPNNLLSVFIYRFLQTQQNHIYKNLKRGAAQPHVYPKDIAKLIIPIPSLAEQKHIVAILDEAFAAIATATANTKKNIANAKELFDSELNSVFQHPQPAENSVSDVTAEWRETTLGETCEILDRRRKPITKRNRISGPYPYYGATGIVDYVEGYLFDEPLVLVGEDGAKWDAGENSAFAVNGRCWVNNHAHVLRPNRSVLLDNWLIYYLNQSDLTPFITGLTVPKLNQAKLCEIAIPLPPLFEQKRIATFLDKLSAEKQTLVETYKTKIHSLAELKQSLLHQAFTGELTAATKAAKSPTPAER